jgi:uncharacterized protein
MIQPDYEKAKGYVWGRLERELASDLYYHSIGHTLDEVLPAAERLATLERVSPEELLLLRTAALYHDIGYIEQYYRNEDIGAQVARDTLGHFGFAPDQIDVIGDLILATRIPQRPASHLQQILCDADLDTLGRKDFFIASHRLRLELAAYDKLIPLVEWYPQQLAFLEGHTYFTDAAMRVRQPGKLNNIQEIKRLLAVQRPPAPAKRKRKATAGPKPQPAGVDEPA